MEKSRGLKAFEGILDTCKVILLVYLLVLIMIPLIAPMIFSSGEALLSVIETLIIVFIQALMTAVFLGAVFIPLLKEIYKKLEGLEGKLE